LLKIAGHMKLPLEVGMAFADQGHDDLEGLLEPGEDAVLRQAEGVGLAGPLMTCPKAERESPPLSSSSVSAVLAMMPGFRWSAESTHEPILAFEVTAATAPASEIPSQQPRGGPSSIRQSSSSAIQIVSNPISSARTARARICGQEAVVRSGPYCMFGRTIPSSSFANRFLLLPGDTTTTGDVPPRAR
jgi:hypothetical protein